MKMHDGVPFTHSESELVSLAGRRVARLEKKVAMPPLNEVLLILTRAWKCSMVLDVHSF